MIPKRKMGYGVIETDAGGSKTKLASFGTLSNKAAQALRKRLAAAYPELRYQVGFGSVVTP